MNGARSITRLWYALVVHPQRSMAQTNEWDALNADRSWEWDLGILRYFGAANPDQLPVLVAALTPSIIHQIQTPEPTPPTVAITTSTTPRFYPFSRIQTLRTRHWARLQRQPNLPQFNRLLRLYYAAQRCIQCGQLEHNPIIARCAPTSDVISLASYTTEASRWCAYRNSDPQWAPWLVLHHACEQALRCQGCSVPLKLWNFDEYLARTHTGFCARCTTHRPHLLSYPTLHGVARKLRPRTSLLERWG